MVSPKELLDSLKIKLKEIQVEWDTSIARKGQKLANPSMFQQAKQGLKKMATGVTLSEENAEKIRQVNNLKAMNAELNALKIDANTDPKKAYSDIRRVMLIGYVTEYAEGREDKKTTKLLSKIEDVILNPTKDSSFNALLKNEDISLKTGTGHEHLDSRFLAMNYRNEDPELPAVIKHIFEKVVGAAAISNDENKTISVNYMKALVRVGLAVAGSEWNALATEKFGADAKNNPFLITVAEANNPSEKLNESNLGKKYDVINTQLHHDTSLMHKITDMLSSIKTIRPEATPDSPRSSNAVTEVSSPASDSKTEAEAPPPLLSSFTKHR